VSLFNFLDKEKKGTISFEEMLYKIVPGAKKWHVEKMLGWVETEDNIKVNSLMNYKTPMNWKNMDIPKQLTFGQIRDYVHVFTRYDDDFDGNLSKEEFERAFQGVMDQRVIDSCFEDPISGLPCKMGLVEFLKLIKPTECVIPSDVLHEQAPDYMWKVLKEKRNNLIDKGFNPPMLPKKKDFNSIDDSGISSARNEKTLGNNSKLSVPKMGDSPPKPDVSSSRVNNASSLSKKLLMVVQGSGRKQMSDKKFSMLDRNQDSKIARSSTILNI